MTRRDDGTTLGGALWVLACICCLVIGYWLRDQGVMVQVQQEGQPPLEHRRD